jgi:hypothetical protein
MKQVVSDQFRVFFVISQHKVHPLFLFHTEGNDCINVAILRRWHVPELYGQQYWRSNPNSKLFRDSNHEWMTIKLSALQTT